MIEIRDVRTHPCDFQRRQRRRTAIVCFLRMKIIMMILLCSNIMKRRYSSQPKSLFVHVEAAAAFLVPRCHCSQYRRSSTHPVAASVQTTTRGQQRGRFIHSRSWFSSLSNQDNDNDDSKTTSQSSPPKRRLADWDDIFLESTAPTSSLPTTPTSPSNNNNNESLQENKDNDVNVANIHPSMMFDPENSQQMMLDDETDGDIDPDYETNDLVQQNEDIYDNMPTSTFQPSTIPPPNKAIITNTDTANESRRTIPPTLEHGMDDIDMNYNPYDDDNYSSNAMTNEEINMDDIPAAPQLDAWDMDTSNTRSTSTTSAKTTYTDTKPHEEQLAGPTNDNQSSTSTSSKTQFPKVFTDMSTPHQSSTARQNQNDNDTLSQPSSPSRVVDDKYDDDFYAKASSGNGATSNVDMLRQQLQQIEQDIYQENNGESFNINSSKQLSKVLFGPEGVGQSTNKYTLEAMGGGNTGHAMAKMADLVLLYRRTKSAIKREEKRTIHKSNGNHVTNVHQVHRTAMSTTEENKNKKGESIDASSSSSPSASSYSIHEDMNGNGDPLLLVDASAYIFRAYYSMPTLHRSDGTPVGAVLGFCNMLNRLVLHRLWKGERPRLVLVFDAKGPTFRHEMYKDYKANRPECPMDLIPQFDLIRLVAQAYGIQQLEAQGFEADDVIATLATMAVQEGVDVNILSGDKDLMQLITPEHAVPSVHMIDPKEMARTTHDGVVEKWGVPPELVGDLLALTGDSSDNIPGIKGIGPKGAAGLLKDFGSLDKVLENAKDIPQKGKRNNVLNGIEDAKLSRQLVELERCIPKESMTFPGDIESVSELRMEQMHADRLLALYQEMGFKRLTTDFRQRMTQMERQEANKEIDDSNIQTRTPKKAKRYNNVRSKIQVPRPEDFGDVPF